MGVDPSLEFANGVVTFVVIISSGISDLHANHCSTSLVIFIDDHRVRSCSSSVGFPHRLIVNFSFIFSCVLPSIVCAIKPSSSIVVADSLGPRRRARD